MKQKIVISRKELKNNHKLKGEKIKKRKETQKDALVIASLLKKVI